MNMALILWPILQRYVAQGSIQLTDITRSEGMTEWVPVSQVIGNIPAPAAIPAAQPAALLLPLAEERFMAELAPSMTAQPQATECRPPPCQRMAPCPLTCIGRWCF